MHRSVKRLLVLIAALLAFASQSLAVNTPLFVQRSSGPSSIQFLGVTNYFIRMPNAVLSGNALICAFDNDHGGTPTSLTDDVGHTLTLANSTDNGNSKLSVYFAPNATGARTITANYAGAVKYNHMACGEFAHVATSSALDSSGTGAGICAAHATNTSLDCSAFSTTQANDLVFYAFDQNDTLATVAGFTQGTGYTLGSVDNLDSLGFEYAVQAGVGAATPTATLSASHAWQGVGALFKYSAGAGTEPSGMRITSYASYTQKATDTGPTIQFPCVGAENLVVLGWNGAANRALSTLISANTTGTWGKDGDAAINTGSGQTSLWHLPIATCGPTTTITLTETGGQAQDSTITVFGITGAKNSADPIDGSPSGTTGNSASGVAFTGATITAHGAGISIWGLGANTGSGSAIASTSAATFLGCGTVAVINTSPVCENQGWSALTVSAAGSNQITWTPNGIAIGNWSDYGAHFLAPAAAGGSATPGLLLGVGEFAFHKYRYWHN